jgi:thymidylate synthase (FAD)
METKRPTNPAAEEILGQYFPVLDNGFISIVDYLGTDECIESAARVSYGAGTRKISQTRGLIRYLKRHRHTTPSEMVELKFHVCCPIFVMRQWIRHRTSSTNELSGRYSLLPLVFYSPTQEQFKTQSKNNNQGRGEIIDEQKYEAAIQRWNELRKHSSHLYTDLAEADVARELARIDLPLSTYTQFYWKVNLHNLFHFLGLRADSHAQWEIREFAKVMAGMTKRVAPLSFEAWMDYDIGGASFSRMELKLIKDLIARNVHMISAELDFHISENYEMSKREITEFLNKLQIQELDNFELDLTKAKTPEYFQKIMQDAVPKIDANTPSM